ncbi:MAG: hypothetical protein ABJK37_16440 [Paraglaciecola sp.]|uniref:hypothetical protein n=1 Tax=Paraglaciecola sp. TaxID=1920173 RepID=UPI0032994AFE
MYKVYISLIILFSMSTTQAKETNRLTVDRVVTNSIELAFPNDKNIKPKLSDFELFNYIVMSNEEGERWAVMTLNNTSSGSRVLEHHHLMALFADGNRSTPLEFKVSFRGKETQSITVSFGENKFPILSIFTETAS